MGWRGGKRHRGAAPARGDEGALCWHAEGAGGHHGWSRVAEGDAGHAASASGRGHGAGAVRGPALPCGGNRFLVLGLVSRCLVDGLSIITFVCDPPTTMMIVGGGTC